MPSMVVDIADHPGRISPHNGIRRYILGHNTSCSHDRILADTCIGKDRSARTDGCPFSHYCVFYFPITLCLQIPAGGCRAWIAIVHECNAMSDEDVILDRHTLADKSVAGYFAA